MKKKNFLYPTRGKVLSTFIIFGFILAGTFIWDTISQFMVPSDLVQVLNQSSVQMLADKKDEIMAMSMKVLALGGLINLIVIYFAVCIVFNYFKNE